MRPMHTTLLPNCQAVQDGCNAAFGKGGDGSISGHGITGCDIGQQTAHIVENHGRFERV